MNDVPDPRRLQQRLSDADRHQVADVLREAAGEGRLDLDELDERLEAAYAAKVYGDLVPLLGDLPTGSAHLPAAVAPRAPDLTKRDGSSPAVPDLPTRRVSLTVMGGQDRKGVWAVGESHQAFALMGGIGLDLREAVFTHPEVVITANAVMGGIDIVVNARTRVVVDGLGIMGTFDLARDRVEPDYDADSPVVRVRGVALMGAVTVVRKPMPGPEKRRRPELGH